MKKALVFFLLTFFTLHLTAQTVSCPWTEGFAGNITILKIAVDTAGNVYSVGYFSGNVDFDPSADSFMVNVPTRSGFITKMDANGHFIWEKTIIGDMVTICSIVIDKENKLNMVGWFYGSTDFNPSIDSFILTVPGVNSNYTSGFILKLDNNGNSIWAKQIGGTNFVEALDVKVDENSNVYFTGDFYDTADFNPGIDSFKLYGGGFFIAKLDKNGNFIWAKNTGTSHSAGMSMDLDKDDNIYTTGFFQSNTDFDLDSNSAYILLDSNHAYANYPALMYNFIAKYNKDGKFVWAKHIRGIGNGEFIKTDNNGNVVCSGLLQLFYKNDSITFNQQYDTVGTFGLKTGNYIIKLDSMGNAIWAKTLPYIYNNPYWKPSGIAIDSFNNIYTTCSFKDTFDFSFGAGKGILTSNFKMASQFLLKQNSYGDFIWVNAIGNNNSNSWPGTTTEGTCVTIDANNNIYASGTFKGKIDINPTANIDSFGKKLSPSCFLYKLQENPLSINNINAYEMPTIYPNPNNGICTLLLPIGDTYKKIIVTNIAGQTVFENLIVGNTTSINIDCKQAINGLYFVKCINENSSFVKKIIIEK